MPTRNGKIAHLPNDVREQLNLRLLEGETGAQLVAWLNALPDVQSILSSQFNGSPISDVNLTHWRQGGYLQWRTERECFDSAQALADGDGELAKTGLSAQRLLNFLTLRYGQLLMRWDRASGEDVPESAAFSEMARKARILQGISRSVLAIHRIQSQSASAKTDGRKSTSDSKATAGAPIAPAPKSASPRLAELENRPKCVEGLPATDMKESAPLADSGVVARRLFQASRDGAKARPAILSGVISPASAFSTLSQTPYQRDVDLAEILSAV